jgi:hypothetical protein
MDTTWNPRAGTPASTRRRTIGGALAGIAAISLVVAIIGHAATDGRPDPAPAPAAVAQAPAALAAPKAPAAPAAPEREVCLSCGVVASVKPVVATAARPGGVKGFFHSLVHRDDRRGAKPAAWDVRVRMDDGSTRTLRVAVAPKVGAKVDVAGTRLRPAPVMI